jgi:hypothetical protein
MLNAWQRSSAGFLHDRVVTPGGAVHGHAMSRGQATAILVLVSSIATGCSTLLPAGTPVSTEGGVEQLPGPAYLHLAGDPATTPRSLKISYVLPDGSVPPRGDVVEANTVLDMDLAPTGTTCTIRRDSLL